MKRSQLREKVMLFLIIGILGIAGCGKQEDKTRKVEDLSYTVVAENEMPQELKENLEGRKTEPFKVTYADKGYIYICIGYGEQTTGGYSIKVKELYLSENAIYVDTVLLGPVEEEQSSAKSCPYIVLKTEYRDKAVVFE